VYYSPLRQKFIVTDSSGHQAGTFKRGFADLAYDSDRKLLLFKTATEWMICSSSGEPHQKLDLPNHLVLLAIMDGSIYVVNGEYLECYSLEEGKYKTVRWKTRIHIVASMAGRGNELFVTEDRKITVYSRKDGTILRQWAVADPWGIVIYNDVVYVTSSAHRSVDLYDLEGGFLGALTHPKLKEPYHLGLAGHVIYVSDWKTSSVFLFEIPNHIPQGGKMELIQK
jgi:hypothetical protein